MFCHHPVPVVRLRRSTDAAATNYDKYKMAATCAFNCDHHDVIQQLSTSSCDSRRLYYRHDVISAGLAVHQYHAANSTLF